MFTLIIEDKDGAIADEYSFEEGEFIIGRSHSSDIILPADNVSRRHARLYTQESKCYVEDLNSSNGVFVNGKRIHRVFEIVRTAQIKVGDYYLHVEGTTYASTVEPERRPEAQGSGKANTNADVKLGLEEEDSGQVGRLIGTNLSTQGHVYDLARQVMLVGRGKDCAVTVIDPSVSRVHAKIMRNSDGTFTVEDLRSSNGTYINDERVESGQFKHGDAVRFGNVGFMCELPGLDDVEYVESSSGSSKRTLMAIAGLVAFLCICTAMLYVFRDSVFGSAGDSVATQTTSVDGNEKADQEQNGEKFKAGKKRIERLVRRTKQLAGEGDWTAAKETLEQGAKALKTLGDVDVKGELTSFFQAFEESLLAERNLYQEFEDALLEREYATAGIAYQELIDYEDGVFAKLAKLKLTPVKDKHLARAEALCAENLYDKCLDYYKKAKALDPTDKLVAKKVAKTRLRIKKD